MTGGEDSENPPEEIVFCSCLAATDPLSQSQQHTEAPGQGPWLMQRLLAEKMQMSLLFVVSADPRLQIQSLASMSLMLPRENCNLRPPLPICM